MISYDTVLLVFLKWALDVQKSLLKILIVISYMYVSVCYITRCGLVSQNWVAIGPDNGLSPLRCQAIAETNTDLPSIQRTKFNEIRIETRIYIYIYIYIYIRQMHLRLSTTNSCRFCPGLKRWSLWRHMSKIIILFFRYPWPWIDRHFMSGVP